MFHENPVSRVDPVCGFVRQPNGGRRGQTLQFVILLHRDRGQRADWRWSLGCKVQSLTPSDWPLVLGLVEPGALARCFAGLPAFGPAARTLTPTIPGVGNEKLRAIKALARSLRMHRPASRTRAPGSIPPCPHATVTGASGEEKPRSGRRYLSWESRKKIHRRRGDFLSARNRRLPTRRLESKGSNFAICHSVASSPRFNGQIGGGASCAKCKV